jgi:DnaJ-domain-containing protein 1
MGVPPEMIEIATQRLQKVNEAYEQAIARAA